MLNVCKAVERATCRAKAGGRDDHEDDPATNPDNGPIAGCREIEWWRPLATLDDKLKTAAQTVGVPLFGVH